MIYLLIPYMAIVSRLIGKGRLDEVFFGFGITAGLFAINPYYAVIAAVWSTAWFNTGHANVLPWGGGGHNPDRENTLSPLVKKIADKFDIDYYSRNYARLFMAVKGLLITLPFGGLGVITHPLGYEIGVRVFKDTAYAEWISGGLIGCLLVLIYKGFELCL